MINTKNLLKALILLAFITSCKEEKKQDINVGNWQGMLINNYGIPIPFSFEYENEGGKQRIIIKNADESLVVEDINTKGDSVQVTLPFFDAELRFVSYGDSLSGYWIRHLADKDVHISFRATNHTSRFKHIKPSTTTIFDGTWPSVFIDAKTGDTSTAIGEFKNENGKLKGTFLTTTGDYRYLEGVATEDSLYLSTFDGSHAYLFVAAISDQKILNGVFYSGIQGKEFWTAQLDNNAKLPDADKLTFLKDGFESIDFKFNNIEGKEISLSDSIYKDKIVLIQIMGTWCPNCMDETSYLTQFYADNKKKGVEIIGLCYERSDKIDVVNKNILNMKKRLGIEYELLIAGTNKKGGVNESLPMLKNFVAFPTMIILDKNHKVRKIHTGYSGPATGKHYIEFKSEFERFIQKLQIEK